MSKVDDFRRVTEELYRLYRESQFSPALEMVEAKAASFPEQAARITFWRVCLLCLCGRKEDALATLAQGLDAGLWWHESLFGDSDLDPIRDLTAFKDLTLRSQKRWTAEHTQVKPDCTLLVPSGIGPYPLLIALHGYSGNKDSNLEYWDAACRQGWLVLSPQSRQPLYPGAYFWDSPRFGIGDILFHLEEIRRGYRVDPERIITAGFSQGSGMAILAALSPRVPARGFISAATWWGEIDTISSALKSGKSIRGYFITGLKDHTLERTREIQAVLKENHTSFEEEVHPDLGHEFPLDFNQSLENALNFILDKEHE